MIDIKETRGHTVEGDNVWLYTKKEFVNGDGNEIDSLIREKFSFDKEVLNKYFKEKVMPQIEQDNENIRLKEVQREEHKEDLAPKITRKKEEVKELIKTRGYIEFKKYLQVPINGEFNMLQQKEELNTNLKNAGKEGIDIEKFFTIYDKAEYQKFQKTMKSFLDKGFFRIQNRENELEALENKLKEFDGDIDRLKKVKEQRMEWVTQFNDVLKELEESK